MSIVSGARPQRQAPLEDYGFNEDFSEDEFLDLDSPFDSRQSLSTASSNSAWSEPTTELHELFLAASDSITSLLKLSIVIRNPAPKDRYAKLAPTTPMDSMYDVGHVWQKYPQLRKSPWLINRLGKAITRRREFFHYRERHRQKLSRKTVATEADNGPDFIPDLRPGPVASAAGETHLDTLPTFLSTTAPTISFPPTQASIPQDEIAAPEEDILDDAQSETSYATSVGEDEEDPLRPPPRPREAAEGRPFECPYCFVIVVAPSNKAWKYAATCIVSQALVLIELTDAMFLMI